MHNRYFVFKVSAHYFQNSHQLKDCSSVEEEIHYFYRKETALGKSGANEVTLISVDNARYCWRLALFTQT